MNAIRPEHAAWSRRKWAGIVGALLLLQVALIAFLGARPTPIVPMPGFRTAIHMAAGPSSTKDRLESDPAEFALPNWNGFSREGWLAFHRPELKPADWAEPPRWLSVDAEDLGNSLHGFILSNTIPSVAIANKPLPRPQEFSAGNVPIRTRSELSIDGPLERWTLEANLPSWPHADLLTNTVVRALVDASGLAVATVLLSPCGLPEADELAVQTVRNGRFRPAGKGSGQFTSGNIVFHWHTVAPTNMAAAPASPGLP